ncbi:MAG: hypothetical protein HY983_03525 [Candidatus Magasanikbacteria bacterium]|nr:hypothetical protein [Candidatus Magasanikbacteria bacterium]
MHFANLLYSTYWFGQPDPAEGRVILAWLVVLVGLIVLGAAAIMVGRESADRAVALFARRFSNCALWLGIVGLLFFLLRQERVAFLGWRVWFLLWLLVGGVWAGRLAYFWFKRVPAIRAEQKNRVEREEFLPKRKK